MSVNRRWIDWRNDLDSTANRNENASAGSGLFCHRRGACVDSRRAGKGVERNLHISLQVPVGSERNIDNVMRLQRDVMSFPANNPFVIDHIDFGLSDGAAHNK